MRVARRTCQLDGCNNLIESTRKTTRACSTDCSYALRSKEFKRADVVDGNPLNSNSNELIRMINKFLLMKTA